MILAVHQPQFAPWLGYFDKLDRADVFVLLDTVQFKKNEWQNRNRIKSATGPQWLTVPVSFRFRDPIREVRISDRQDWRRRHLATLRTCYQATPFFDQVYQLYADVVSASHPNLSELSTDLLKALLNTLGVDTPLLLASELGPLPEERDARLIQLCRALGAATYLAGAGGRSYMNLERYQKAGIEVVYQEYQHPSYPQLFGDFAPHLSVLDLLFNVGPGSREVIRSGTTMPEAAGGDR